MQILLSEQPAGVELLQQEEEEEEEEEENFQRNLNLSTFPSSCHTTNICIF